MGRLTALLAILLLGDVTPVYRRPFPVRDVGLLRTLPTRVGTPVAMDLDPSGERVAVGGDSGLIRILHARTGRRIAEVRGPGPPLASLAFDPSGARLAAGFQGGRIALYSFREGKFDAGFSAAPGVTAIEWLDAAALLVGQPGGGIASLSVPDGKVRTRYAGGTANVLDLVVSPSRRRFAALTADGSLLVYEVASGKLVHRFDGVVPAARGVDFHPDGRRVAYPTLTGVRIADVLSIDRRFEIGAGEGGEGATCARFTPEGDHVLIGDLRGGIRLCPLREGATPVADLSHHTQTVRRLALEGGRLASLADDGQVKVWGARPGGMAGVRPKGYLGVQLDTDEAGCRIVAVMPGTAAEAAGIRDAEVLVSIDGQAVANYVDAVQEISSHQEGEEVGIVVRDAGGAEREVRVRLRARPEE